MQNRSMFPYRRHGSKKRRKVAAPGPRCASRAARRRACPTRRAICLPMLQPATKALAQMLAGRTAASGQLEQARAMLGQAERLIADRVHNRLNPAEREEFFEQLARLRLTLGGRCRRGRGARRRGAGAAAPAGAAGAAGAAHGDGARAGDARRARAAASAAGAEGAGPAARRSTSRSLPRQTMRRPQHPPRRRSPTRAVPPRSRSARRPRPRGRAGCSPSTGAAGSSCRGMPRRTPRRPCRSGAAGRSRGAAARRSTRRRCRRRPPRRDRQRTPARATSSTTAMACVADAAEKKSPRRSRKTQTGLPEGWIIDEEGFVVPGPR